MISKIVLSFIKILILVWIILLCNLADKTPGFRNLVFVLGAILSVVSATIDLYTN